MASIMTIAARDSIIRLAATPAHKGDLAAAAAELSARPGWARRPDAMRAGLREARRMVIQHCGVKAAERALDG